MRGQGIILLKAHTHRNRRAWTRGLTHTHTRTRAKTRRKGRERGN